MNAYNGFRICFFSITVFLSVILLEAPSFADDEVVYFNCQFGSVLNANLTNINSVGGSYQPGTTASNLDLQNSFMYGAKLGIYSRKNILALEAEVFRTEPNIRKQRQTFHEPSFGPYVTRESADVGVTTLAINVIGRVPVTKRLVVYGGLGPAFLFSTFKDTSSTLRGGNQQSNRLGLNTLAGVNYFVTKHIGIFAECKYNYTKFKVPYDSRGQGFGFNADYNALLVSAGIGYYFDLSLPKPITMPRILKGVFGLPVGAQPPR